MKKNKCFEEWQKYTIYNQAFFLNLSNTEIKLSNEIIPFESFITNLSKNCVTAARQEKTLNYFRGKPEPSQKLNNQNKVQSN